MSPGEVICPCFLLLLLLSIPSTFAAPEIVCPYGRVTGLDLYSPGSVVYYGYRGIRYGIATRFNRASAVLAPEAGLSATVQGPACPQVFNAVPWAVPPINEDCLYLDVYLPGGTTPADSLPVLVYIHGGSFTSGHIQDYDPWKMVTEGRVIVVTIQYRLGALGFASTGDSVLKGNLGLWDQRLAVQWVRNNIRDFGGDVNSITLIGQSAGAASVGYHLLTNVTHGQFNRGILISGTPNAPGALLHHPRSMTMSLARHLGCVTSNEPYERVNKALMMECMKTAPLARFLSFNDSTFNSAIGGRLYMEQWSPTVDGEFVRMDPKEAMKNQAFLRAVGFHDHDVIIGVNNNEGASVMLFSVPPEMWTTYLNYTYFQNTILPGLVRTAYADVEPNLSVMLAYAYTAPVYAPTMIPARSLYDVISDVAFYTPAVAMARAHAHSAGGSNGNTNVYLFDHYPNASLATGIPHGLETGYLFGLDHKYMQRFGLVVSQLPASEFQLANDYTSLMTQFARTGIEWPDYGVGENYLSLTNVKAMRQRLYQDRVAIWLNLVPAVQAQWQARTIPPPCIEPSTPRFKHFPMDIHTAETAFIGVLSGGIFLLILLLYTWCHTCRRKKEEQYPMKRERSDSRF